MTVLFPPGFYWENSSREYHKYYLFAVLTSTRSVLLPFYCCNRIRRNQFQLNSIGIVPMGWLGFFIGWWAVLINLQANYIRIVGQSTWSLDLWFSMLWRCCCYYFRSLRRCPRQQGYVFLNIINWICLNQKLLLLHRRGYLRRRYPFQRTRQLIRQKRLHRHGSCVFHDVY